MGRDQKRKSENGASGRSRVATFLLIAPLNADERTAVDSLKASTALGADADVVRLALWRLAAHYDLRLPIATFAIGGPLNGRNAPRRTVADRRVLKSRQPTKRKGST